MVNGKSLAVYARLLEFLKKILQFVMLNCGIILYSEMQKSELLCEVRYERAKIRYKENYYKFTSSRAEGFSYLFSQPPPRDITSDTYDLYLAPRRRISSLL